MPQEPTVPNYVVDEDKSQGSTGTETTGAQTTSLLSRSESHQDTPPAIGHSTIPPRRYPPHPPTRPPPMIHQREKERLDRIRNSTAEEQLRALLLPFEQCEQSEQSNEIDFKTLCREIDVSKTLEFICL
eukprot:GHVO01010117.1.p1 GENE.GHVO01010117.1~~GHVO01010117.1.p1  ORF type:complete len:129 (-),score=12.64 GHVO01010117.1:299-685(-)